MSAATLRELFPRLSADVEAALRTAGRRAAADAVPDLTVVEGVVARETAELSFDGPLRSRGVSPTVEGRSDRTRFFLYLEGDRLVQLSLQDPAANRAALRRVCISHDRFDWDAYYGR